MGDMLLTHAAYGESDTRGGLVHAWWGVTPAKSSCQGGMPLTKPDLWCGIWDSTNVWRCVAYQVAPTSVGCVTGSRSLLSHIPFIPHPMSPHPTTCAAVPCSSITDILCKHCFLATVNQGSPQNEGGGGGATAYFASPRPCWSCVRKASQGLRSAVISIAQAEWVLVAHALLQVPGVQKLGRWHSMTTAICVFPLSP